MASYDEIKKIGENMAAQGVTISTNMNVLTDALAAMNSCLSVAESHPDLVETTNGAKAMYESMKESVESLRASVRDAQRQVLAEKLREHAGSLIDKAIEEAEKKQTRMREAEASGQVGHA